MTHIQKQKYNKKKVLCLLNTHLSYRSILCLIFLMCVATMHY